jgi:hypothetical protein
MKNKRAFWVLWAWLSLIMSVHIIVDLRFHEMTIAIAGKTIPLHTCTLILQPVAFIVALLFSAPNATSLWTSFRQRYKLVFCSIGGSILVLFATGWGLLEYVQYSRNQETNQEIEREALKQATPLMKASFQGDIAAIQRLLAAGANVNERNASGFSALDYATGAIPPYDLPGTFPNLDYPVISAKSISLLLEHGANANISGKSGITPLMRVVWLGRLDLAQLLLSHGADVNQASDISHTPLSWAVMSKHEALVRFLLAHGANPNPRLEDGHVNLLALAYKPGNSEIIAELEKAGAHGN